MVGAILHDSFVDYKGFKVVSESIVNEKCRNWSKLCDLEGVGVVGLFEPFGVVGSLVGDGVT